MNESSSVRELIILASAQLKAGETTLIDATPEESIQAKERLEKNRWKGRERLRRWRD